MGLPSAALEGSEVSVAAAVDTSCPGDWSPGVWPGPGDWPCPDAVVVVVVVAVVVAVVVVVVVAVVVAVGISSQVGLLVAARLGEVKQVQTRLCTLSNFNLAANIVRLWQKFAPINTRFSHPNLRRR